MPTPTLQTVMDGCLFMRQVNKAYIPLLPYSYNMAGANPSVGNHVGLTPLHAACKNGHLSIVTLLLEAKADVNAKTTCRKAKIGHEAITNVLLQHQADPMLLL